jgi:putative hydrolase of the HAD superfamily
VSEEGSIGDGTTTPARSRSPVGEGGAFDGGQPVAVTTIMTDIGGVLLTNGWDRAGRRRAAEAFHLDPEEMDERHLLTFDTFEVGKLTLDEYLTRLVFYEERPFTRQDFKEFMFAQSSPYPEMIDLICRLKERHRLKLAAVTNEGRELMIFRMQKFALGSFLDFIVASSFVHFRKPDPDIWKIAIDLAQVPITEIVYIEDRPLFVDVARDLGIRSIRHTDVASTRAKLEALGLKVEG